MSRGSERHATYENQDGIEVLMMSPDKIHIVLGRLPLVHHVEVEAGIAGLGGLVERSESILEPTHAQRSAGCRAI